MEYVPLVFTCVKKKILNKILKKVVSVDKNSIILNNHISNVMRKMAKVFNVCGQAEYQIRATCK